MTTNGTTVRFGSIADVRMVADLADVGKQHYGSKAAGAREPLKQVSAENHIPKNKRPKGNKSENHKTEHPPSKEPFFVQSQFDAPDRAMGS